MIVRSTSNNIRENIFFLVYYFERDFRLSPKRVNFVTKVGSGISLLYYLRENIFFFYIILREYPGSDFRAKFFLVTKLGDFGDSQEYL